MDVALIYGSGIKAGVGRNAKRRKKKKKKLNFAELEPFHHLRLFILDCS